MAEGYSLVSDEMRRDGRKARIKYFAKISAISLALVVGSLSAGQYLMRSVNHENQLGEHQNNCTHLLESASGRQDITTFINDEVTIREGFHKGKTCREIINEYDSIQ